ncbi:MAG: hypothetical protein M9913_22710 [Bryobacteraceae bacterium]|nr:hypothetical protein [Solibacteraceae bacterium]MCL4843979.1 hypothetical protein [Bryobacteraceae bacterium]MCO5353650.1 hypothetical protein [Bryobacteraceae bacterium]HRJ18457.1 hypothetical protein [Bryobacteraceae bacterium]
MTNTLKCLVLFLTLALAVASASTHSVQLFQPSIVSGQELKPGQYKLTVDDSKVIISKGKQSVEASVKMETSDSKFSSTSVRYITEDGKMKVSEIRLGGTNTKLVFN